MKTIEVLTKQDKKEFIDFPKRLYKNDPFWVCPLDAGVESVFNPAVNHSFRNGVATRWILQDDNRVTIGRVAAFIDEIRSAANAQPTGGMGYFEVIESRDAAFMLFDTAKNWLAERGIEAMDGPINFGENDTNWGLLVEGFMQQGYGMPYNMKYYKSFFEEYGFKTYFEQYSYHRMVRDENNCIVEFPPRVMKIAKWLSERPGYTFRHFEMAHAEKFVNDIVEIYNATWSVFKQDFTPLDKTILYETLNGAKAIIDEEIIWFAYHNEKPISFFIVFPDANQILKHFNGKLHLWNKLRFLYYKFTRKMTRARALVGGVHPSYQNSGVESAIFYQFYNVFRKKPWITEVELSWTGDFNSKMIAVYEAIGAIKTKTHITYRYMINKNLTFKQYKDEMDELMRKPSKKLAND
jgi:GNAT superfamily N-acetyltransferase